MFYWIEGYSKEMVRPVKGAAKKQPAPRAYDSSRRQAQARETQRHIAECARELFVERGYTATSIRDIADRAGVAVQTIYNAFDGKPAIVNRISDMAVVGDDEPVALAERDEIVAIATATDPVDLLDRWTRMCAGIFSRFLPILPMLHEAVASEPIVRERWRTNAIDDRYAGTLATARRLGDLGALPPDLPVDEAADLMWALASFESAHALMVERGWTAEQFAAGLRRTFVALLGLEA